MIKIRNSQAGFTLIEIIAALAITGLLFGAATTAFSAFFSKYEELNKVSDLETQAYDCLQKGIKYGLINDRDPHNIVWSGVANADSVAFLNGSAAGSTGIILTSQAQSVEHANDYVKFWFDGRAVRGTYLFGSSQPSSPIYIFPKPSRNNKITVTNLRFSKVNTSTPTIKVLRVDLSAKVEIRKNIFRYVNYSTKMAINKI